MKKEKEKSEWKKVPIGDGSHFVEEKPIDPENKRAIQKAIKKVRAGKEE
ncbi:hypothetical protein ISR94_00765 [Candidatus Microgenomates bacterium]|nr:hypothetical protein [Candidatus Microgenomates bacterium]